jgi:hypothetical protein
VNILGADEWPFSLAEGKIAHLTPPFGQLAAEFGEFYKARNSSHVLNWMHDCANCELAGTFESGKFMFNVSTVQAMILLTFNDTQKVTYTDLKNSLQIGQDELRKNLAGLFKEADKRLLKKIPDTKAFNDSDSFEINLDFTNKSKRIKIRTLVKKET